MKKIVVMPVKNEAWILEYTLSRLSLWADHIIVADQRSTDGSKEMYGRFPKVLVLDNPAPFHSSSVRKLLLDAARSFEGNNAIFSFDADEIPTGHIVEDSFWAGVSSLRPGTGIEFLWLTLWRSPQRYRVGRSVFAPQWKQFGFVDDRRMSYDTVGVINDHVSRIPQAAHQSLHRFELPKVLHYQFVNWDRTVSKQVYYRMSEWVQREQSFLVSVKINLKYFPSKDEHGLEVKPVPTDWLQAYANQPLEQALFEDHTSSWYEKDIAEYFTHYGSSFFAPLDIWYAGGRTLNTMYQDPRTLWQKFMQSMLYPLYILYRLYQKVRV